MDKKYLLYPGHVVSETDGKRHYITAKALMKLYNVPPEECVVWIPYRPYPNQDKLIALHPMANGKYKDMQKQEEEENGKSVLKLLPSRIPKKEKQIRKNDAPQT